MEVLIPDAKDGERRDLYMEVLIPDAKDGERRDLYMEVLIAYIPPITDESIRFKLLSQNNFAIALNPFELFLVLLTDSVYAQAGLNITVFMGVGK